MFLGIRFWLVGCLVLDLFGLVWVWLFFFLPQAKPHYSAWLSLTSWMLSGYSWLVEIVM